MHRYQLSPEALDDLEEIWRYIARDSVETANRVQDELFDTFERLAKEPALGHPRPEVTHKNLRFWVVYSYLVVFKPGTEPLQIFAVIHGARNLPRVLRSKRFRTI